MPACLGSLCVIGVCGALLVGVLVMIGIKGERWENQESH